MEKQKRWQFYLIIAVIALTLYNILPTVFYYSKPLKETIQAPQAEVVALDIIDRVNSLEQDSKEWLYSFSNLLGVQPVSVELKKENPRLFEVSFKTTKEAALFQRFLNRAGALIPFVPAQLELNPGESLVNGKKVLVARQIAVHLDPAEANKLFLFSPKEEGGAIAPLYREIVDNRVEQLALALAGPSKNAMQIAAVTAEPNDKQYDDVVISLAKEIVDAETTFKDYPEITKRYLASFTQIADKDSEKLIPKLLLRIEKLGKQIDDQKQSLVKESEELAAQGSSLDSLEEQRLSLLENQSKALHAAAQIIKKRPGDFKGKTPLNAQEISELLAASSGQSQNADRLQTIDLKGRNPFIQALTIDWNSDLILVQPYADVLQLRASVGDSEAASYLKEKVNQEVINEIALASQIADEKIDPKENYFSVNLNTLTNSKSFLAFNLGYLAEKLSKEIAEQLNTNWQPLHTDLSREAFPINSYDAYKNLAANEQKLGLVVYAPAADSQAPLSGFHTGSIYVIAKGMDNIIQKYKEAPDSSEAKILMEDTHALNTIMQQNGFIGYPGSSYGIAAEYAKDYIFELNDYYNNLIKATRENFSIKGDKRFAVLDFTDVEQRILALNRIDDRVQEDLLKWKEAYSASLVDTNAANRYQIPAPTENAYWQNFKLSAIKYFRGDDRKILKWGLDLSGGKTIRIGLRDQNNRPVTDPDQLKQALNELYTRVNKLGVSERTIHIENNNIILDFPGSQALSAAELVKASAMYFHIVNEKFSPYNVMLRETVNKFLQNVWNEAVVTNRKDSESINEIAWQHLGGDNSSDMLSSPRSESARTLYENGLRLVNPKATTYSHSYNDALSAIGIIRGDDFSSWEGQTHPLVFVFHNYALEGSSLENIRPGYDPSQGNNLSFGVSNSYKNPENRGSPREDLYTWTSQFAADKIAGTPKEAFSEGRGWRMAVILNGTIISMPTLQAALRDGGTITGRFSQREVNQLASDLQAGSLSFTPRILSEENVSPELGAEERMKGIVASTVALVSVVVAMVSYYFFAGVVASCAVLFNILIMWGILQNIGATLSLPTIAGIVLTIGMAVDANVLVFERIREEFALSGRIAAAIQAGYRKAFSAIIDSNITTIIAALILIQFDSGPIKGFAVSLIVGIISSMFTSLFVTRYFFAGWVQNPANKSLRMSQFFGRTNFDFLSQRKNAVGITLILMVMGTGFFFSERNTMFGMDFTGGYSLNLEVQENPAMSDKQESYRLQVLNSLLAAGASTNDVQVRELSRPNQLRIQLGIGMEEKGHPFYRMPEVLPEDTFSYIYQKNPRLTWIVDALEKSGITISPNQLSTIDSNWTVMSGQFSEKMRNNTIIGLAIALASILLYITIRFEFKFAIAAVIALVHDVFITLGFLALFRWLGFAVQIDLQVVGAIMTIIGYSLNDTIIVFDRIREDTRLLRKLPFNQIVNHALNVTLSRTVMTSGTTLLVLLSLVLLGGQTIFAFSLIMFIGVLVGTFSSLYIAPPVMLYFHERELKQQGVEHKNLRKA